MKLDSLFPKRKFYVVQSGYLSLFQAISVTQAGKPEEKLELAFRLYDIDRNGTIEESEMQEIIRVGHISLCSLAQISLSFLSEASINPIDKCFKQIKLISATYSFQEKMHNFSVFYEGTM